MVEYNIYMKGKIYYESHQSIQIITIYNYVNVD